jgi:hypothetical protein
MWYWIDVEDSSGNRLGDGPILTAESWEHSPALDEAGTIRFTMPASDPRAALLTNKRVVHCLAWENGEFIDLGRGIVDEVRRSAGDPTTLEVSGPDILAELSTRSVRNLELHEQGWGRIIDASGTVRGGVRWLHTENEGDFGFLDDDRPAMYDNSSGDPTVGDLTTANGFRLRAPDWNSSENQYEYHYLYVGFDARFDRVFFDISVVCNVAVTLHAQYYNGSGWVDLTISDGTYVAGLGTFRQSGYVSWTRPTDWSRCTPTAAAGSWFWIRFTSSGERTNSISVRDCYIYGDVPTLAGVDQIMALAPSTWTRSGYPDTAKTSFLTFAGETVLAALRSLAEGTGEHFRLGSGRAIEWLGTKDDFEDAPVRAMQAGDIVAMEANTAAALITELSEKRDSSEAISRIIPYGSGGVSLASTSRTAPSGYVLNKASNYIERTAAVTALGVIERYAKFDTVAVQQDDSYLQHPALAADDLFDQAYEYLRTHSDVERFYSLAVARAPVTLLPGQVIHVSYHEYRDGVQAIEVEDDLYVLTVRRKIDQSGAFVSGLTVATIDRQAATDASVIRDAIQSGQRSSGSSGGGGGSTVSAPVAEIAGNVTVTGGTIDGTVIGGSTPERGSFTDLFFTYLGDHAHDATPGTGGPIDHDDLANVSADQHHAALVAVRADSGQATPDVAASVGVLASSPLASTGSGADVTISLNTAANITWTGLHTFQATMTTRNLLPELTDTYDIGSSARLYRKGYLSELDALIFAEQTISLVGGWLVIPKDQGTFPTDVAAADTAIDFGDAMTAGHLVVIRAALKVEYLQVGALVSGTTYAVTRDLDGSGANDWPAGTVYMVLGTTGDGRIELNAYDTPRISIMRQGAAYNLNTEVLRLGDLSGVFGVGAEAWGLGVGDYAGGKYLVYDGSSLILEGGTVRTGAGAQRVEMSADGLFGQVSASAASFLLANAAIASWGGFASLAAGDVVLGHNKSGSAAMLWDQSAGTLAFYGNAKSSPNVMVMTDGALAVRRYVDGVANAGLVFRYNSDMSASATYDAWLAYHYRSASDHGLDMYVPSGYFKIDAGADAGKDESSYPNFMRFAMNGGLSYAKLVSNPAYDYGHQVALGLGDSSNTWAYLKATNSPGLKLAIGTGASPREYADFRGHSLPSGWGHVVPQFVIGEWDVPSGAEQGILPENIKYLMAVLTAYNHASAVSFGHLFAEAYKPTSGYVNRYFATDSELVHGGDTNLLLYVNSSGGVLLKNSSAYTMRVTGLILYFTA